MDDFGLLNEIRSSQQHIAKLAAGEASQVIPTSDTGLEDFLKSLATAWRDGEVRPTHRPQPTSKPRRHWRTRRNPFEDVWPRIREWLTAEPDRTSDEILRRLQWETPGQFTDGQLRTLQRRVKEWRRREAVRDLVFAPVDDKARCERSPDHHPFSSCSGTETKLLVTHREHDRQPTSV